MDPSHRMEDYSKSLQDSCGLWDQTLSQCRQSLSSGKCDANALHGTLACMAQLKQETIKHQTTLYLSGYTDMHLDQYFRELIVNHSQIETLLQDSLQRVNTGYSKSIHSTSKSRSSKSSRHSSLIATMKAKASSAKVRLKYLEREQQIYLFIYLYTVFV